MLLRRLTSTRFHRRTMSTVSDFVAAAIRADPNLQGLNDTDKAAIKKLQAETERLSQDLPGLDKKLTPSTYLYSNLPSTADVELYCHLHPTMASAPSSQHPSQPSVLRYFLHVQSLDSVNSAQKELPNSFPPLDVDISSLPAPPRQVVAPVKKEKKAKAAAAEQQAEGVVAAVSASAASAVGAVSNAVASAKDAVLNAAGGVIPGAENAGAEKKGKKEKKEKPAKAQPAKEEPSAPNPSMIDLRVGKVLHVSRHPDADSLYVEKIDVGEEEPRTVCSGLVKYMKEEDILGKSIIVVCNLKPVKMRGLVSYAMLLCASSKDGKDTEGGIEFVLPPAGSQPGERIYFEGFETATPEAQLNPKKKVFETIQPSFTSLDNLDTAWINPDTQSVHKIRTKDGYCRTQTLVGASLS